ncbi:hypothetical protein DENSPDRAFT_108440 [Dentipellis sp. KUC8613]|nr:hypothetical protein DENSPDRAFT_108440 [Dentipellis sp. KUC8613]
MDTDESTPLIQPDVKSSVPRRDTRFVKLSFSIPDVRLARPRVPNVRLVRPRVPEVRLARPRVLDIRPVHPSIPKKKRSITTDVVVPMTKRVLGDQRGPVTKFIGRRGTLNLDLLVATRLPWDKEENLAKSFIEVWSYKAKVKAIVRRLPGAESHFIHMTVRARKNPVTLVLPSNFRGTIHVHAPRRVSSTEFADVARPFSCSQAIRRRIKAGDIRLGDVAGDDEDELVIQTRGKVILLMDDGGQIVKDQWYHLGSGWLSRKTLKATRSRFL